MRVFAVRRLFVHFSLFVLVSANLAPAVAGAAVVVAAAKKSHRCPAGKVASHQKKRVKVTGSGKLLTERAGKRHLLERKPSRLTRRLTGTTEVADVDAPRVKKLLGR